MFFTSSPAAIINHAQNEWKIREINFQNKKYCIQIKKIDDFDQKRNTKFDDINYSVWNLFIYNTFEIY